MDRKRIVIVGGVAGGASAAARARRLSEEAEIILFERGEHVSFANCGLPYHIGGAIAERRRLLVETAEGLRRRFRLDVRVRTEVLSIDRENKTVTARRLDDGARETVAYDALILSPGAEPIRPPMPGFEGKRVFTLRNLADMDAIKRVVDEEKPARSVIIGGGYIGLEMAEALRARGVGVTLVELSAQLMGPADPEMTTPLNQQLTLHGVDLRLETSVSAIREENGALEVQLSTGETVACALVVLAIGVRPEVTLAREAGLALGERGGIRVDERMRTSDPAIYAVGDAVEVTDFVGGQATLIPLAGPANRQGRIAADNIFGILGQASTYKKTQGTAICKVFDLAIGMTGMSEKALRRAGRACEKVYVHPASHAGYYPGASPISLKLVFDPENGRILGAQAVGAEGVDKRIDVLAVAIRAGMSVFDLEELELSYAPPYGSAKDPVNIAGFVAANVLRGAVGICHAEEVAAPRADQLLLDVRTTAEFQAGTIPGAFNLPLDDLRERLGELPRDKELLVFCQVGQRGYLACRILSQNGFQCRNLSGGYKTVTMATPAVKPKPALPSPKPPETRDGGKKEMALTPGTEPVKPAIHIDACGLQCPGPIMRLASELKSLEEGQAVSIETADPAFAADVAAWCRSTGHRLLEIASLRGHIRALIAKGKNGTHVAPASAPAGHGGAKNKTIVVFSADFDRVMAALIIANGAATMGGAVTLFFTFWGLNVLRRPGGAAAQKNLVERMFGWLMPRGAERLSLSRMNLGGLGLRMIKGIMRRKNVPAPGELLESARQAGVRLVACAMSMDLMGIKREELIDGVEIGGVATYLGQAETGSVNLFI